MPRDERDPVPLMNMNPAGLPGLLLVLLMFLGMWQLFGPYFVFGMAMLSVVGLGTGLIVQRWRAKHPRDKSVLHLSAAPKSDDDKRA